MKWVGDLGKPADHRKASEGVSGPVKKPLPEVDALIGDASLAEAQVGWKPRLLVPELVKIMVEADAKAFEDRPAEVDRPDLPGWQLEVS